MISFKENKGMPVNGTETKEVPVENVAAEVAQTAIANEVPETVTNVPAETPKVDDTIDFDFGDEPAQQETTAQPQVSWQDAIKTADKTEVLKAIGMDWALQLDDFDKEFSTARKSGIDPYKYLEAKAVDWNKVPEETLLKEALAQQYPGATPEDLDFLFNSKYVSDELDTEVDKRTKEIAKRSEVARIRANKTEESKKFSIPANTQPQITKESVIAELQKEYAANNEVVRQKVLQAPEIKNVLESKRVALDLGELGNFNFGIKNPNEIVNYMNDGDTYHKYTSTPQGEPDMEKAVWSALLNIVGPKKFTQVILAHAKRQTDKTVLEEGRNTTGIKAPLPGTPSEGKITFRQVSGRK